MSNIMPEPQWGRLPVGDVEKHWADTAKEIAAHPERKAKADVLTALAAVLYLIAAGVGLCLPALVWLVYMQVT